VRSSWPFNHCRAENGQKDGNKSLTANQGPDFLCIGLHKGGTTWLYQQLDSHPDFWMPPIKELHYLDQLSKVQRTSLPRCRDDRDLHFLESLKSLSLKPHRDLENYARLFELKRSLLSGDISPNYSALSSEVIRQVTGHFQRLKVIFLARDPVERFWSHLSMEVHYGQIQPFDATSIDEINRNLRRRGMLLRSYPSVIAARWKRHVHPDRFRICFFDDLQRNPAELRCSILNFLGADPKKAPGQETSGYNSWAKVKKLPLTEAARSHLAQFFKKELKTCAARLGGSARDWPARYGFALLLFVWNWLENSIDFFFQSAWIS
jgi:hypothetical protein